MNQLATTSRETALAVFREETESLVTLYIGKQMFGMPVHKVRDILVPHDVFGIPLAPMEVAGVINLRGRIVTVIDMRRRLGLPPLSGVSTADRFCITVDHKGELYGLLVDRIGDVLDLSRDLFEETPTSLGAVWREFSHGVYRLDQTLLVELNVDDFLNLKR